MSDLLLSIDVNEAARWMVIVYCVLSLAFIATDWFLRIRRWWADR